MAIAVVMIVTFVLTVTETGHTFIEIFFEVVSALGTVGLSMGITGSLTTIGKVLITLTMFFGRLGPLTIVVALARRQQDKHALIRYPEEKITVG
jgi:trk system potassium uptake protein TrkH